MIPTKKMFFNLVKMRMESHGVPPTKTSWRNILKSGAFLKFCRNLVSPLIMFLNSSLSGRLMVQAPSDESVSPPKIIMSLSISSVGDEKFLPEDPSCN